jgi:hypothetical protein
MALVMLPDPIDTAIRRIRAICALRAAPLDAILAKIECNNIAHKARAPPTTTLPHPGAMLSTPPCPMTYVGAVLSTMGGSTRTTSLALAPLALPLPTIDGQLWMVRQCTSPWHFTGHHHRPCTPSPPDEGPPSLPQQMMGGSPTPTATHTRLARATSPCHSQVSSPPTSLMTPSPPYLLPFTFSDKACLPLGGATAHPFRDRGKPPTWKWKHTQRKRHPCRVCQHHGPRAPNQPELFLCRQHHQPCAPNQSTSNGWA